MPIQQHLNAPGRITVAYLIVIQLLAQASRTGMVDDALDVKVLTKTAKAVDWTPETSTG